MATNILSRHNRIYIPLSLAFLAIACSSPSRGLFTKKTAHEQYASRLADAGLAETELGTRWLTAAQKAITQPVSITLPYKEAGYFAADKPTASGFLFPVRRGEKVLVQLQLQPAGAFRLFADLWKPGNTPGKPDLLATADTTSWNLEYEVEADGQFLLRLQPELLRGGRYEVAITTGPSIAFPVSGSTPSRIGSFWGDNRDGGKRSHEGIDIFGKFRTPVVAAADGYITSTRENNLGGKVVFLRPKGKSYTLYYAHLDEQLVRDNQEVRIGDTVGLMGNTGNAKHTPTHLHFGIYTSSGAVDPMPFVLRERKPPVPVTAPTDLLQQTVRNTAGVPLYASPARSAATLEKLPANRVMAVAAATGNWYRVVMHDGKEGFIESKSVSAAPYRKQSLKAAANLLDQPDTTAAVKLNIPAGKDVQLLGQQGDFHMVLFEGESGWVQLGK
ncbi:M23 family metallopeptidase [Chitinophaga rhizophila]|uniref:M23 family metallopeptidase n=1 Tax=Chitinophaga rhizophila TaxID=2866212 RepID=A0ABS7GID1_9BACT|nr:M23 family metallopeptidase [Chitinophaga rhizophila]MBW8687186.1 M23 family metallopeptidase [Chitinophaga rhizophila]